MDHTINEFEVIAEAEEEEDEIEDEEKQDIESLEKDSVFQEEEKSLMNDLRHKHEDTVEIKDGDEDKNLPKTKEDVEEVLDEEAMRLRSARKDRAIEARKRMMQLLEGSSVSGLSHAAGAPAWIAKIIWSVLLIAGFIGLAYNLTSLFSRFLKRPILTMSIAESEKFHWPEITLCNHMNPIHFWKRPIMIRDWENLVKKTKALGRLRYRGKRFPDLKHVLAMSSLDPVKFHLSESQSMVFRISARTKSNEISTSAGYFERFDEVEWDAKDFVSRSQPTPFPTPCYTFNPAKNAFVSAMERNNHSVRTIKLDLIMNFYSYEIFNSSYENRGIYMYMKEIGSTVTSSEMIQVSPGSTTTVQLSMTVMERLRDRSKCSPTSFTTRLYDADLLTTREYNGTYDDCKHYISQKMFLKFCGCYNPMLPIHESTQHPPRLCFNMSIFSPPAIRANIECMDRAMIYFTSGSYFRDELRTHCSQYKLPPCRSISYKKTQVTRSWPEDINKNRQALLARFARHMGINVKDPEDGLYYVRQNFASVEINKKYTKAKLVKEEYEYPFSQLISDVGGTLGLWLGLSFVGVFELVEILLVVLNYLFSEFMVEKKALKAKKRIKRRQSVRRQSSRSKQSET